MQININACAAGVQPSARAYRRNGAGGVTPGEVYGRLTAVECVRGAPEEGRENLLWRCVCSCGGEVTTRPQHLRRGDTQSCGCLALEKVTALNRTHGVSRTHPLYRTWANMRNRCNNPRNPRYHRYGGRGIQVCARWDSFPAFVADMFDTHFPGATLDRLDNSQGYSPDNCAWRTYTEQNNNRRDNVLLTYQGRQQTLPQWAREVGIKQATLAYRIRSGWLVERALTEPVGTVTGHFVAGRGRRVRDTEGTRA